MKRVVGRGPSNRSYKSQIVNNIPRALESPCPQECPQSRQVRWLSLENLIPAARVIIQESWRRGSTPTLTAVLVLRDRLMFPHAHHGTPLGQFGASWKPFRLDSERCTCPGEFIA